MKFTSVSGGLLLSTLLGLGLPGTAGAQPRRRVACEEGQHVSGGHCCDRPGEEWVEARRRCICLDANLCGGTAATAPVSAPPVGTPPVNTPPVGAVPVGAPPVGTPVATPVIPPAPTDAQFTCPEGTVFIRGTTFMMGSVPGGGDNDEMPAHRVTLAPYCIDRTEATVAQYRQCMQAGSCSLHTTVNLPGLSPQDQQLYNQYCNGARTDRDTHPINCIDWAQGDAYCHSRGGHLPTEAQWELAARGPDQRVYPWGNQPPTRLLVNGCDADCLSLFERPGRPRGAALHDSADGFSTTAPVGTFAAGASIFGLQDMAGNVMEWTSDWFGPYPNIPVNDPAGPATGTSRVARGGHWVSRNPGTIRGADRTEAAPTTRLASLGVRCVLPPVPVAPPPAPEPPPPPPAPEPDPAGRRHHRH